MQQKMRGRNCGDIRELGGYYPGVPWDLPVLIDRIGSVQEAYNTIDA